MKKQILSLLISCFFLTKISAQDLLFLNASGGNPNLTIQSGVSVYVQGGCVTNANAFGMDLNGELHLIDGTSVSSNWTDNTASGSILNTSTGTVYLESAFQQNVTGANTTFYNLVFHNTSANTNGIRLLSNCRVANQVTFRDGLVYANGNTLYVSGTAANAIVSVAPNTATYSGSWISALYTSGGKLDREMTNSSSTYDFPVGSTSSAQLLQVVPTTITGISRLSASWENGVTGNSPLTISECGTSYTQVSNGGEWHLRPANGGAYGIGAFAGGNMTLQGWNLSTFPGIIDNQFALVQRAEGDATPAGWAVPNPGCSSLAPTNSPGRTIASNFALRNSINSYSDAVSQLGIGMTLVVLPIELLSFSGYNNGNVNELVWQTASEFNSDYFDLERSFSGIDYESIGQLSAAGFSQIESDYHFTDQKPNRGLNYYRLKAVDRDNSYTYSNIVLIQLKANGTISTVVSPNPAINNINIQLQSGHDGVVTVQLTDALGKVVRSQSWNVVSGSNFTTINTTGLAAAMYFVNIYRPSPEAAETYKVVKKN